ncbi:sulfite exporter TauE/SafE [Variibacter gotjawalensis]|uniref:Probable membrane transporter protein n=1 Tax=Variibacter gotjawalensis TaxID=1333996 RepID=A0A0S3PVT8_9BRAD|nr:sulfite exporter TauE/SafE family protein [Variibacter gotjawalensis]NIK45834.1 hypothetical protein [Variibacter gotjawalensis]RZS47758.1 hypothetical protein EV661_0151 [Variibacter gotjawalensis]BAT60012.1 sulfite exporter TauE/SafE [Variibacter gotjawalensis]
MPTDTTFWIAVIFAVSVLGLSKGGFAGVGGIATPLMALFLPPLEAAALLLPIMILQDAISVWFYRRDFDKRNLMIMLPGAVIGIAVAWGLAAYISDSAVKFGIGFISLLFILQSWFAKAPEADAGLPSVPSGVFWGALSGFTSTLAQQGSPPFQVYVLPQRLPKLTFVGTVAIFFATVNAVKVIPYFALGNFSTRLFTVSLMLMPLAVLTNMFGFWVVRVMPTILFYRVAHVLVFVISLELIREGLVGMFWR